jgi:tetratricopeptide (TPR) repeat protein
LRASGAAADAGIAQGDLLIEMNGSPITSGPQFNEVWNATAGRIITVKVIHSGEETPVTIAFETGAPSDLSGDRDDPITYFLRARGADLDGPLQPRIDDYTRAIELAPDFDLAYLYRGQLRYRQNDYEGAMADYDQALALNPWVGEAWVLIAEVRLGNDLLVAPPLGEFALNEALKAYECDGAFEGFNVDCSRTLAVLAHVLHMTGRNAQAIEAAHQALRFWDAEPHPYFALAWGFVFTQQYAEADAAARAYLEYDENLQFEPHADEMRGIIDMLEDDLAAAP